MALPPPLVGDQILRHGFDGVVIGYGQAQQLHFRRLDPVAMHGRVGGRSYENKGGFQPFKSNGMVFALTNMKKHA